MNTRVAVSVPEGPGALEAVDAVFAIFRRVEATANEWREESPLARVNREAGGAPVPVPPELMALLERGRELGTLSGGAFDITWAALWGLWDFNATDPRPPDTDTLASRVALIDYRWLELDPQTGPARLPKAGMAIGLGGIAKGYALDLAADELRRRGISSFLLSAGGQYMVGGRHGERPWRIAVRDPRGASDNQFALLEVVDGSVSTSGDYERCFVREGRRFHHVLDPRTGMPATGVRSVTVIARSATEADALSTALMVMGVDRGLEFAGSRPDLQAMFVDDRGGLHLTPGLEGRIELRHPPIGEATTAEVCGEGSVR